MAWIAPVIGGFGSLASAGIGASQSAQDRKAAIDAYNQSVNDYNAISPPSIDSQQLNLQGYQSAGNYDPTQMAGVKLGDSNMLGVATDPQYKAAQLQALTQLQNLGQNGGMQLSDQANLENIMNNVRAQEAGSRGAIMQQAAQQGGYGNGMGVVNQLMNQQNAANLEHQAGLDTAAQAQQRALQSIISAGQLGGQMQGQDFNQQAQKAQAQDAINAWNAQNSQGVNQYNTGLGNQAALYNLQNQQNLSNANTNLGNSQQMYNKQLGQQQFGNQMALAQGKANARAGQANQYNTAAQGTAQGWANIGSGMAQLGSGLGQYANSGSGGGGTSGYGQASQAMLDNWNQNTPKFGQSGGSALERINRQFQG